ncbi:hypothetical protein L7F22_058992 [Adiantum nelumboides]|nr:hypothetical protein [Adiantum nelumboides]
MAFMYMKKEPLDLSVPTSIMRDLMEEGLPVSESLFKNLLKAYWKNRDIDGVEEVFQAMRATGHTRDQKVIFKVMNCQKRAGNSERILELMETMKKLGMTPNLNVYDELISAYCKAGLMEKAKESLALYSSDLGKKPTVVAFNNLIHGYGKQGDHEEALQAFEDIESNNHKPDDVTFSSIIAALVNAGQLTKAAQLYRRMGRRGVQVKLYTYVTLILGYAKHDWTREGRKIVKAMQKSPHEMTPEAFGAILVLFLEGHWYHLAASALTEIETGGIPINGEASAALIRSFSILGDKPTPLSIAVEKSNLAICKLLTSLFLAHSDNISRMEAVFEEEVLSYLQKLENLEHKRAVYNAFMDCFWRRGFKTLTRRLLSSAREVYAQNTKPEVIGSEWVLDVRGLSVGGAKAALIDWLSRVAEGEGAQLNGMQVDLNAAFVELQDDSKKLDGVNMVIVTGNEFQLKVFQDHRVLKSSISGMLADLKAPFVESSEDPKKLEAAAMDVFKWVASEKVKELLDFTNKTSH